MKNSPDELANTTLEGEPDQAPFVTLEEIKALPERAGAYYVKGENQENWDFRFRVVREHRRDRSRALHPQITASNGVDQIRLGLSKSHGWYIQAHNGYMEFNRQVLRYLNRGVLSINEAVQIAIGEDPDTEQKQCAKKNSHRVGQRALFFED